MSQKKGELRGNMTGLKRIMGSLILQFEQGTHGNFREKGGTSRPQNTIILNLGSDPTKH